MAEIVSYEWKVRIMIVVLVLFVLDLGRAVKNAIDVKKISDKFRAIRDKVRESSLSSIKEDVFSQISDLKKQLEESTSSRRNKKKNRMFSDNPNIIKTLKDQTENLEKAFSEMFK